MRRRVALGLLLAIPSLFIGYFADDWILLHDLRAGGGGARSAVQLYQFARHWMSQPGEPRSALPWFAGPGYRTDFLRPLSGLLFWFDEKLGPQLGHLHSLLWWALLLLVTAALFRKLLPPRTAMLALLIFAVDDAHWMPVAWLANRHALVATTFVFAGLLAHLRWRDEQWRPGAALSLLAYTVGLSAGEAALQALSFLFALELVERKPGWWQRLLPAAGLVLVYAALRGPLGAGVEGSGEYFDPLRHPLQFAAALPARLMMLLGDLLGGMPCDFYFALRRVGPILVAVGIGVTAVFVVLVRRALRTLAPDQARRLLALIVGGILALLPGAAGLPGSRLLFASTLGSAALVATLLYALPSARLARVWLIFVHLIAAPLWFVANELQAHQGAQKMLETIATSELSGDVVVVTTPDPFVAIYPPYIEMGVRTPRFRSWQMLLLSPLDVVLTRPSADQLRLETRGGRLFDSSLERLLRDRPVVVGETVRQGRLTAHVESPTSVRFDFSEPLDSLNFVIWHDHALRRLTLPPPGGQVTIVHEPGMIGL